MPRDDGLDRRTLLKGAGLTVVAGAAGAPNLAVAAARGGTTYDFDTVYSRIGTDSVRWDQPIAKYGEKNLVAGMGVADMDFRCAPVITEALKKRIAHENWGYLDPPKAFAETIARWNLERYGERVNLDNLEIVTSVHAGIIAALRAFSPPGSRVLLTPPTYNGFYADLVKTGVHPAESPLRLSGGRYALDFEDFERRIGPDTKVFLLCNPQNPTGNCWSRDDLTRIGEICLKKGVIVLADEIHCDFVTKGHAYTPFSTLDKEIARNSITFKAASKSFSLPAMKCAWFYSDNSDLIARVRANNRTDLTTLGMIASHAAYTGGKDWLEQVLLYIDGTMDFAERYIGENIPLVKFVKPEGTYLAWLDVREAMDKIGAARLTRGRNLSPASVFEEWLVKNAKVHLNAGHSYGPGGEGHMRMNLAASRKTVTQALANIAAALRKV
jgi:cysteine-S-conjugate beta-lyase